MHDDLEKGIKSVTFFIEGKEDVPIKISRGEERIFVWCFFLALLEVDGWANEQNAHIFIDDPVSSLDEHNIFITADSIFQLIETNYEKKRIFITTHHIGLLSILDNRLTKGEKSGRYKNLTTTQILRNVSGDLKLQTLNKNFLYHLHLLEILDESRKQNLYTYHFSLLRQLLENVASFIGTGRPGHALTEIGVADIDASMHVINTHSHKNIYYHQTELMSEAEQGFFNEILDKLVVKYSFNF
jgi:wobble nucleotide-excising tRNase